ncbi:ABC transporter ATP-binding protein [Pengzhenrongella frigida]|uniref:ABC transporter ATP-binding protein n=1 Tax=Pengzhenrongella frigida TaxID=1259133 RepID=UPI0013EA0B74|nr:ABC transporter ATP-binding protein [Cellulomonas sp. HLT2-17]
MNPPAAELVGVRVEYPSPQGQVVALRDVSFTCPAGTSTALTGPTGSGKSTLVAVLSLLRRTTSGTVRIGGHDTAGLSGREIAGLRSTKIGVVLASFHLETSLTAAQNVMMPWFFRARRAPRREAQLRAVELLDALEIGDLADRSPHTMTGGQRHRVAIARALFSDPAVFLADEPADHLDEDAATEVATLLLSLPSRFGTAVVLVTHDEAIAGRADRRVDLVGGEIATPTGSAPRLAPTTTSSSW